MSLTQISIIIPVLNEAENIETTLLAIEKSPVVEIIVVDGGSTDQTVEIVKKLGIKVISSEPGRAKQMNLGATVATGEILLFLHGDTLLPSDYLTQIKTYLSDPNIIAGAFELKINSEKILIRLIEAMVKLRSYFCSLPYGDQGIFLKADLFREISGFLDLPIMEDFNLIQRLKKQGKIAIIPSQIITSDRRWQKLGIIKTTIINQLIILGYYVGIDLQNLKNLYHRFK